MLASVLPGRAVLVCQSYITPASRHGGRHQGHHGGRRVVRYAYRTGRTGVVEQLCTRPGLPGAMVHAWKLKSVTVSARVPQQRYSAFTATFCEVGCILAWTPITESKVLNYVLIAESTVLSTGAGLAASLSFGEIGADLLGMVGDNPFHSI